MNDRIGKIIQDQKFAKRQLLLAKIEKCMSEEDFCKFIIRAKKNGATTEELWGKQKKKRKQGWNLY